MSINYTSLLGLAEPVTGSQSGTWGDDVNKGITEYLDIAIAGTQTISGSQTAVTLSLTNGSSAATNISQVGAGATGTAQYAVINCTGNPSGLLTITAPASSRQYIVINATSTSQSVKIVGAGPTTGTTIPSGVAALVAWNGSDFRTVAVSNTVTPSSTDTLTNKTISADNNTLSGIAASSFVLSNASGNIDGAAAQKVIPAGVVVGTTDAQTLTNKTIAFASNTLTDVASTNTSQALTNKTINGLTPTANATGFSIAGGTTSKTLTVSNSVTLAGTDSSTLNIGNGGTLASGAFVPATGQVSATASGSISAGQSVVVNSDGTVSAVSNPGIIGTEYVSPGSSVAYRASTGEALFVYSGGTNNRDVIAISATVDNNTGNLVFSSPVTVYTTAIGSGTVTNSPPIVTYDAAQNTFLVAAYFSDASTSFDGRVIAVSVTSNVPTKITDASITSLTNYNSMAFLYFGKDPVYNHNTLIVNATSDNLSFAVFTVTFNGSTFTTAVAQAFTNNLLGGSNSRVLSATFDSVNARYFFTGIDTAASTVLARAFFFSGPTSLTYGSLISYSGFSSTPDSVSCAPANGKILVTSYDGATTSPRFRAAVATFSGGAYSFGAVASSSAPGSAGVVIPLTNTGNFIVRYSTNYINATVSGSTVTLSGALTWGNAGTVSYALTTGGNVLLTGSYSSLYYYASSLSPNNFLGFSAGSYTNGQTAVVTTLGGTSTNQTGLTAGNTYYVSATGDLVLSNDIGLKAGIALSSTNLLVRQ